jgi:hypothetical protein
VSIRLSIVCDGCGAVGAADTGWPRRQGHQMRAFLREIGWSRGGPPDSPRDYCMTCRPSHNPDSTRENRPRSEGAKENAGVSTGARKQRWYRGQSPRGDRQPRRPGPAESGPDRHG